MIDFIRFKTASIRGFSDAQEHSITENVLNPDSPVKEMMTKDCWKLKKGKDSCIVEGSLHNYYENDLLGSGLANTTDFSFSKIDQALENLSKTQEIDLYEAKPTCLEFGYNIEVNGSVRDYLDSIVLFDEKAPTKSQFNSKGEFKSFRMSEYEVKCYNKGLHKKKEYEQLGMEAPDNLLRVEVRYYSDQLRKRLKIESVGDLANKEVLEMLHDDFVSKVIKLQVVDDPIKVPEDCELSTEKYYRVQKPEYWSMRRGLDLDSSTVSKEKKLVKEVLRKCCSKKKGFLLRNIDLKHKALMNG